VKTELMSYDVLLEEFGGDCQCVEISAKQGTGIDELLEKISLQSEVLNLKAVVDAPAAGSVIEARVDKGLGVVVTALVQKGTLSVGDLVLAGPSWGRVRRLVAEGIQVQSVGPSTPVQVS
jgi:translation initiation factor IF-2